MIEWNSDTNINLFQDQNQCQQNTLSLLYVVTYFWVPAQEQRKYKKNIK